MGFRILGNNEIYTFWKQKQSMTQFKCKLNNERQKGKSLNIFVSVTKHSYVKILTHAN